jgi:hypothetical protein
MRSWMILTLAGFAICTCAGQTPPPPDNPQRTIRDTAAFKSQNDSAKTSAPRAEPLQKPAPQRNAVATGSFACEEATASCGAVKTSARDIGRGASAGTLDSLNSSTENLNVIRDANLKRLLKDGCAPAVSARIVELRARLDIPTEKPDRGGREGSKPENSAVDVASAWYKAPAKSNADAANSNTAAANKSVDLLDAVLPVAKTETASKKAPGSDTEALKIELDQLLTACPSAK